MIEGMSTDNLKDLLGEQIEYYRARAGEYDEWFLRQGRYDRGSENKRKWFAEIDLLRLALADFNPCGEVLELACGTGIWTEYLLQFADRVTAVDTSSEMLAINRERTKSSRVNYLQTDLFDWQPDVKYDALFFAFWLSHVPPERFKAFWKTVDGALKGNGRVFFIDSLHDSTSTARDHRLPEKQELQAERLLNDGRRYRIFKVFYELPDLERRLYGLDWNFRLEKTGQYFFYGQGKRIEK
ncbi:MAG: class I SAM-dependent methyltransferase [Dehalococcoidales bacterium]|nr:class I SAM-dependent methyltransferase [Dehalococcoidales bacterium]